MRQLRGVLSLVGSVFAATRALGDVRAANTANPDGRADKLLLANAIATVLVVLTGGALALRDLRKGRAK